MNRATKERAAEELARRHLVRYTQLTYPLYKPNWHHWMVGDVLESVLRGERKRVIINEPPRHGKSEQSSVRFPPYAMAKNPGLNFILGSYAAGLATGFGRKARNQVRSAPFKRIFHGVSLARDVGTAGAHWALNTGGEFNAAGVKGGVTGKGAHIFGIDDPIKGRKQADSVIYREDLKDWYRDEVVTRLTPNGAVIISMTRWHHDDLCGWLLREWPDEDWFVLRLPAIQDMDPTVPDPRKPGQALWETMYNLKILEQLREEVGPNSWNCTFQQSPTRGARSILQTAWLVQDFDLDMLPAFNKVTCSWDTAFEEGQQNDYNVGTVWGDTGFGYYLLDVVRMRATFPDIKRAMIALHEKWNSNAVLIERKASGHDLYHELRNLSDMPIIPIVPNQNKKLRAEGVSGRFEAGRIHIPRHAPWLSDCLTEMDQFPEGAYDDFVDSTTQAISWLTRYGGQEAFAA